MGPTIKTNSLVVIRRLEKDTELKGEEIIAFRAERFEEPVVILHAFFSISRPMKRARHSIGPHPEQSGMLDPYQTKREDLLGIYLFISLCGEMGALFEKPVWIGLGLSRLPLFF